MKSASIQIKDKRTKKIKDKQSFKNNFYTKFRIDSILFLCSLFLIQSCHQEVKKTDIKDASPYFINIYKGNDNAVFRDINFNMNAEDIKSTEKCRLYETTEDHLFYEFSYPTDSTAFSEYANLQYFFDENNKLDIITADIYLNDSLQQKNLENSLSQYFNMRYGKSEINSNNYHVWNGIFKDKTIDENYPYTVSLKDLEKEEEDDLNGVTIEYHLER